MSLALLRSSLLLLIKLSSSFTIDVVPSPAPAEIIFPVPSIWKKIIVVQSRNNIFLISQKNFWLPSYWAAGSQPPWRAVWDLSVGRGSPRSQELHQLAWWRRLKAWKKMESASGDRVWGTLPRKKLPLPGRAPCSPCEADWSRLHPHYGRRLQVLGPDLASVVPHR